jgi:phenylpropionate dioxygenase-like ring-hydroxylating dioxygenase large terminal subunit
VTHDPVLLQHWHAAAFSHEVPAGAIKRARILGEGLVIWRGAESLQVWRDLCIHRGARLSLGRVADDQLVCPYHGWRYRADGQCAAIPAHPGLTPPSRARAATFAVAESVGIIWVCLGQPVGPPAAFPEFTDGRFRSVACGPYPLVASAPRVMENGLDVAHLAVVHEGILGDLDHAEIEDYVAHETAEGVFAADIKVWQNNVDGSGRSGVASYQFQVLRPFVMTVRKPGADKNFAIFVTVAPVDEFTSLYYSWVAMDYDRDTPASQISGFQDRVIAQDIAIIESQRPELLPLDLQAELHLRSDRASIAYRQWLNRIGLTFGTS